MSFVWQWLVLLTSFPAVMVHVFLQVNSVMEHQTVQVEKMKTEPTATLLFQLCHLRLSPQLRPLQVVVIF